MDHWKKYAFRLESERDSLNDDNAFWRGVALLGWALVVALGVAWLSI